MNASLTAPTVELQNSLVSLLPTLPEDVFRRKHSEDGRSLLGRQLSSATKLRVLTGVCSRWQQNMQDQLKTVYTESSAKVSTAIDELQLLMNFNSIITQAAAKTMGHLSLFSYLWEI